VGEKSAISDSTCNYEVTGLGSGLYRVEAQAPFPGYEAEPQSAELASGEIKVVDIYFDFKKTIVEGYVHDAEGSPISGATISGVLSGKDMDSRTSDQQGYFKLSRASLGDRFIRVNAQGYLGATRDLTAEEGKVNTLEFRLTKASCKICGKVRDSYGRPLRAGIFLLKSGIVIQKTTSDAETGNYEFSAVPGIYEVLPMAQGCSPKGRSGIVSVDANADFSLEPAPETLPQSQT
jgi:hypothetical protein